MSEKTQVQDEPKADEIPNGTPSADGVSKKETPAQTSVDAEELRRQYEAKIAKFEEDMNRMKSSLQRRESEITRQYQSETKKLKEELEKYALQGMDDEQRKAYEQSRASQQMQELQQQLIEAQQQAEASQANLGAMHYFISRGVPADKLVVDQGYDELWQSGMSWIESEFQRLQSLAQNPPQAEKPQAPEPPEVSTNTGAVPKGGPSWDDLRKKYGDDETVYRLVESGQLPPTIIPVPEVPEEK